VTAPLVAAELFSVRDKAAVVTGASSGLGARIAEVLARNGARVALVARRKDKLAEVARRCPGSVVVPCDLSSTSDRARLIDAVRCEFGTVDILVNNAGTSTVTPALDDTGFAAVVDLNLTATFELCQAAARWMTAAGGGVIVNIASVYGLVGSGSLPQAGYAASKGAVVNLTRELAAQWAGAGVRVNALCPAWFRSEMTASMVDGERGLAWISRRTPMGRPGHEDELDGALLFLASRASSYVTGVALPVDGGYTAI
jgi:NAD(P)-dependent dehydrogenase (short-subunit alcohol dehydrogenase family)